MLKLQLTFDTTVPLEVEGIVPDTIRELSLAEIEQLPAMHGNRKIKLADAFRITGDASDERMEWSGDLSGVHWLGTKMRQGEIQVAGDVGRHLGSELYGGQIHVAGSAGDWVGGEMHGGLIHVRGRAGHLVGAAYRGSARGMSQGTILIDGDVGNELGHTMRRGLIAVGGNAGDLVGFNMLAGSLLVFGDAGIRPGANMRRGTIGLLGDHPPKLLPTYRLAARQSPVVMELIFRQLQADGFEVPGRLADCQFDFYNGDLLAGGRGEVILLAA